MRIVSCLLALAFVSISARAVNVSGLFPSNAVLFCHDTEGPTAFILLKNSTSDYSVDVLDFSPMPPDFTSAGMSPEQLKQAYLLLPRPFPPQPVRIENGGAGFFRPPSDSVLVSADGLFRANLRIQPHPTGTATYAMTADELEKRQVRCSALKAGFSLRQTR